MLHTMHFIETIINLLTKLLQIIRSSNYRAYHLPFLSRQHNKVAQDPYCGKDQNRMDVISSKAFLLQDVRNEFCIYPFWLDILEVLQQKTWWCHFEQHDQSFQIGQRKRKKTFFQQVSGMYCHPLCKFSISIEALKLKTFFFSDLFFLLLYNFHCPNSKGSFNTEELS